MSEPRAIYRHNGPQTTALPAELSEYVFGRIQPQAIPLEEAVLGALMLDREALPMVMDILRPESFYLESHQHIYRAIIRLFEHSNPVDLLTVTEELRGSGDLEKAGGGYYLVELSHRVASAANIEYHARIIAQKHIQRELIRISTETTRDAYEDTTDVFSLLEKTESSLFNIGHKKAKGASRISDLTTAVLLETEAAMNHVGETVGIPSGLSALDKETGGWRSPDLVIVAARPAMGKTSLALKFAMGAAQAGTPVAVFSLEMSRSQLVHRMVCMQAGVNGQNARNGKLSKDDFRRMCEAQSDVDALQIYIEDAPALSVMEVRAYARRLKMQKGIGLVIVDYLQLMTGGGERGQNREREVAQISAGLKAIAKELEVPVIALAQLSRAVETRGGSKRPQMSDLRESGAIENDADMVIFPYRPEYYGILEDENGSSLKGVAELIIGKNRHGRCCPVMVGFDDTSARFHNLEEAQTQFPVKAPDTIPASAIRQARENEQDLPF